MNKLNAHFCWQHKQQTLTKTMLKAKVKVRTISKSAVRTSQYFKGA